MNLTTIITLHNIRVKSANRVTPDSVSLGFTMPHFIALFGFILLLSGLANRIYANDEIAANEEGEELIHESRNAVEGQFPWHVGIFMRILVLPFEQKCGGSLISQRIVITAGHCYEAQAQNPLSYRVVAGTLERSFTSLERGRQVKNVQDVIVHPRYSAENYEYDVALFILESEMLITTHVQLIGLDLKDHWTHKQLANAQEGLVTGWGHSGNGRPNTLLQVVTLPYVDMITCINAVGPTIKKYVTNEKFCGGYVNRNVSLCRRYSGGGFVFPVPGSDDGYILRGITIMAFQPSGFAGECFAGHYILFTQVTKDTLLEMFQSASPSLQSLTQPLWGIPSDYTRVPGYGYFKLHAGKKVFGEAWKTCVMEGTNLAVFDSDAEAEAVRLALLVDKVVEVYVGVHDLFLEGHFVTIPNGTPLGKRTRWHTGEPNNVGHDENCVLYMVLLQGLLDIGCATPHPFLCKANSFVT